MLSKIKVEGTIIEENKYYKVIKPFNENLFSSKISFVTSEIAVASSA